MDRDDKIVHTPAEGVRIIGADAADREYSKPVDIDLDELENQTAGDLPPWTEPPTGQVPHVLRSIDAPSAEEELSSGPVWRDEHNDWEDDAVVEQLGGRGVLVDDQPEERPVREPHRARQKARAVTISSRQSIKGARSYATEHMSAEVIMNTRIVTGAALAVIAAVAFLLGPAAIVFVATAAAVGATFEFYQSVRHIGLKPAIPVGVLAVVGLQFAAYARGENATAVVLGLTTMATLIWFLIGASPGRPAVSSAITLAGVLYPGLLVTFACLMLRAPDHRGVALIFAAVVVTAAYDTAAFAAGRKFGSRQLAPEISPHKTVEGAVGGSVVALVVALIVANLMHPWTFGTGFWLAVIVCLAAPLGDLCESALKRDLNIKDMGGVLPGHGGLLDRLDSLLFVVPSVYFLAHVAKII